MTDDAAPQVPPRPVAGGREEPGGTGLALAQLVAEHHQSLYRYAYRLSGSAADAEDLVQQVFLVAHQKLDQIRDAQSVRAWLFTVLRNCYLKRRRKEIALPLADLDVGTLPEEPAVESFDSDALQAAINALDDEFKIVVLMFYFEQFSYREIAEKLEIPMGTVMSRLSRAKAHLRRRLGETLGAERGRHVALPASDTAFQPTAPRR